MSWLRDLVDSQRRYVVKACYRDGKGESFWLYWYWLPHDKGVEPLTWGGEVHKACRLSRSDALTRASRIPTTAICTEIEKIDYDVPSSRWEGTDSAARGCRQGDRVS